MSTLQVGTIKSASSAAPVFQNSSGVEQGELVKQRANYDGYNNTIRSSFGISSVTDEGTGRYRFNFSTAYPNTNYSWTGGISTAGTNRTNARVIGQYNSSQSISDGLLTASSCEVVCTLTGSGSSKADADHFHFWCIG